MTTYTVSYSDPTGRFTAQAAAIQADVLYAANMISRWVPGVGDIAISLAIDASVATANGTSASSALSTTVSGTRIYSWGYASEVATGTDANGAAADVIINVGANFLANTYWVDPTPETSNDIPASGYDFVSAMEHELLHSIVFNGWRDYTTGVLPADYMSTYDRNVQMVGGAPFFTGATATAVYGASVPLWSGSLYHYSTPALAKTGLLGSLMNGGGREYGRRYDLNDLDLAILQDSGVRISKPTTGTDAAETLSSPLAGTFSALGGNDTIRASLFADVIDGGTGTDTVVYAGARSAYRVSPVSGGFTVTSLTGAEGTDTLTAIERVQFTGGSVALDLTGAAGSVAKLLGATFGRSFVQNKEIVGIALRLMDGGASYQQLASLAVGTDLFASLAGSHSNRDFVNLVYRNIVGTAPGAAELALYTGQLDSGQLSQGALAVAAAETGLNVTNINLTGLAQTGLEYV